MTANGYRVGDRVEVIGSSEGFENSYYAAGIIGWSRRHGTVRYETLVDENDDVPLDSGSPCSARVQDVFFLPQF